MDPAGRSDRQSGQPSGVADGRGASPSDLWRPSVRRNDRRVSHTRDLTGMRRRASGGRMTVSMGCPADSALILQTVGVGVNLAWPTEPYARS